MNEELLRRFEQGERDALDALLRRLAETEARLATEASQAPGRLRKRLDELLAKLAEAKAETEKRAESFREELLGVDPSPDAFRARLVMLEMEHASRVRLAEEGLRLLGVEAEDALASARARVKEVCDEARVGLSVRVQPERLRLVEALAEASRRASLAERELEGLREKGGRGAAEAAVELESAQREAAAAKVQATADAHARAALEDALKSARLEAQRVEADLERRFADEWAAAAVEREDIRRRWREAEHALEAANAALGHAREQAAAARKAPVELEKRLADAVAERDRALEQALALRSVAERLRAALEAAAVRSAAVEGSAKAAEHGAAESGAELRKLRAERSSLVERLAGAEAESAALRKSLEAARQDVRDAEDSARNFASRLRDMEERPAGPSAPVGDTAELRAKLEVLRQELEVERAQTRSWQKRLLEADAARDRALGETRGGWEAEKEGYEEALAAKTRESALLRSQLETAERTWQETLARQDAARMQEIFKLRAEVQRMLWRIRDLEDKPPAGPKP